MTETPPTAELRIRTEPTQMEDVITQIGKVVEMIPLPGDTPVNERLFTITPRQPPQTLLPISMVFFAADDDSPVTPNKLRSLFCNPAYLRLEPYSAGLVDDELWVSAAAMLARREGVEQFLVNMLYTLQTTLGVEGEERPTEDVPPRGTIPPYPAGDVGIEQPVSLRLSADKETLKELSHVLGLALVLYEQKHTGRSGVKHFTAKLSQVERDLPALTAKYVPPAQIFAHRPDFTDEFLQIVTDPNVVWSLFGNPLYTGVADFPRLMSDERWLRGASLLMREEGIEQFLVNMLYLMRRSARDWAHSEP
jgi:hypothetical protein